MKLIINLCVLVTCSSIAGAIGYSPPIHQLAMTLPRPLWLEVLYIGCLIAIVVSAWSILRAYDGES